MDKAAAIQAINIIILTNVFEKLLKPQSLEEDDVDDFAAFSGAGGGLVANKVGEMMARAAVSSFGA